MSTAKRATATVAVLLLLFAGCFGGGENLTDTGKGRPTITADFPASVEAGSTTTLEVEVANPGPGDIPTLVIAFALIGPSSGQSELPTPLVALGVDGESASIVDIEPSPRGTSQDGVVFTFEGLPEGESASFSFQVKAPDEAGVAANSVQVYDGQEIDRAAGVRVETTVER
jgi:hypothetical protein